MAFRRFGPTTDIHRWPLARNIARGNQEPNYVSLLSGSFFLST
jgi:hypothetical protein